MTIKTVRKKYPDSFCVLVPLMRNAETKKLLTVRVLTSCDTEEEAERARRQYEADGVEETFLMQTHNPVIREMSPEGTARMFRILYGME